MAHLALIRGDVELTTTDKYSGIGWFPMTRLPPLAFDHQEIVGYAAGRLRAKLEYSDIARNLLDKTFTLGELQRLYEAILGRRLDAAELPAAGAAHRPRQGHRAHAQRSSPSPGSTFPVRLTGLIVKLTISIAR